MEGKKILVVDDDPDIRDVVTMVLGSHGYTIVTAEDGAECLDILSKEKPDLMILDLLMPKVDGFAVFKKLQEPDWVEYKDMPVIILTSVREEASRRRYELETGQKLSSDKYLEKPVPPKILLDAVGKLLGQ
jgi:CheY-like chemotaxis protein